MCVRLLLVLWLALALVGPARAADAEVLTLTRAQAVAGAAGRFPGTPVPVPVDLPDDWSTRLPGHAGSVWYRIGFDAQSALRGPDALPALYIARACSNVEVFLNGQRIFADGSMDEPLARHCHYPQLIALPAGALRAEGNLLDLRVAGHAAQRVAGRQREAGLSALQIGPRSALAPLYSMQRFLNITAGQILALLLAALGVFMVVLGRVNRREVFISYFGWLALGGALVSARVWVDRLPWSTRAVEIGISTAFAGLTALTVLFLLSYARRETRRVLPALLLQCIAVPVSLWLVGANQLQQASDLWHALLMAEVLLAMGYYLLCARRGQPRDFWPMSIILGAVAAMLLLEAAAQLGWPAWQGLELLQWALPLCFFAIGVRLLQVFTRALQTAETSRKTLEARVHEVTAEIERNFAQVAELRVEQVTEKERKRIAGDLHDDLGAKLLTIVHTSESERISTLAREALEEMRLSVRGLTGKPMRLADALADWRAETVMRLGQAGIEADWRSPVEELDHLLPARGYVQTTRILRESVSNIIKHSGASHCKVRCAVSDRQFGLTVQDNGHGIPTELDGKLDRGHGMASMKHRAKQMQGQCLFESGPGYGTVIRLTLPL